MVVVVSFPVFSCLKKEIRNGLKYFVEECSHFNPPKVFTRYLFSAYNIGWEGSPLGKYYIIFTQNISAVQSFSDVLTLFLIFYALRIKDVLKTCMGR